MSNHDRYDMDVLKQLTKIANSLDKIKKAIGHGVTLNVDIDGIKALTFVPNAAREAVGLKPVIVSKED